MEPVGLISLSGLVDLVDAQNQACGWKADKQNKKIWTGHDWICRHKYSKDWMLQLWDRRKCHSPVSIAIRVYCLFTGARRFVFFVWLFCPRSASAGHFEIAGDLLLCCLFFHSKRLSDQLPKALPRPDHVSVHRQLPVFGLWLQVSGWLSWHDFLLFLMIKIIFLRSQNFSFLE